MKTIVLHIATGLDEISTPRPETKAPLFDEAYLRRLREGDEPTAAHFERHFRRALRAQFWGKFSQQRQEDLVDQAMAAALEKIFQGEPRDATRLAAYVRGIGLNVAKTAMRPTSNKDPVEFDFDRIASPDKTAEEVLVEREKAEAIAKVLRFLSVRDRTLLLDVFYRETDRDEVCAKHGVTREQLRLILFRARQRFQECWKESQTHSSHETKSSSF